MGHNCENNMISLCPMHFNHVSLVNYLQSHFSIWKVTMDSNETAQIANLMGPTWGPPGSCRPQIDPMLVPWTLLIRSIPLAVTYVSFRTRWGVREFLDVGTAWIVACGLLKSVCGTRTLHRKIKYELTWHSYAQSYVVVQVDKHKNIRILQIRLVKWLPCNNYIISA